MSDILNDIVKLHALVKDQDLLSVSFVSSNKLLIIDADSSANRLYGDKFNEWVCGGCWNKMFYALKDLVFLIRKNGFNLVVLFNGSLDVSHIMEWSKRQSTTLQQVYTIQQHLQVHSNEFKAPARALQLAPPSLACALRLALLRLKVRIIQTFDSHFLEVGALCAELGATFLLSTNLSTLLMTPFGLHLIFPDTLELQLNPRRLSAGLLHADQLARALDLHPTRLPIFAVLLGGVPHLLPLAELQPVHAFLLDSAVQQHIIPLHIRLNAPRTAAAYQDALVQVVCSFLRQMNDNLARSLDNLSASLFGQCILNVERRDRLSNLFVRAVKHVCGGAALALQELRVRRRRDLALPEPKPSPGAYPKSMLSAASMNGDNSMYNHESVADTALNMANLSLEQAESNNSTRGAGRRAAGAPSAKCVSWARDVISPSSRQNASSSVQFQAPRSVQSNAMLAQVEERHRAGLLHPWVLQVLTEGAIKIENGLEEDLLGEWSGPPGSAIDLFRPLRRAAYAVLLNAARQVEQCVEVSEWVVRPGSMTAVREVVLARMPQLISPMSTCPPPTSEMLWLGPGAEGSPGGVGSLDRLSCMHAFLNCMHIVLTPSLLDTNRVAPPLLIYCCVLRYLLFQGVLRPSELEAALAVAVSPVLLDVRAQRDLRLDRLCPRAVRLSALIMRGIENAIFVNDACATPIPQEFTDPIIYFDGRLFLHKLQLSWLGANLLQLCENQVELMLKVEKMRAAVLDSLQTACVPAQLSSHMRWALAPAQFVASNNMTPPPMRSLILPNGCLPFTMNNFGPAAPTCTPASHLDYCSNGGGGALEVGGVVVANWAPNFTTAASRGVNKKPPSAAALSTKHANLHQAAMQSPAVAPGGPPLNGPPAGPPGCPPNGIQSSPNRSTTHSAARAGRRRRRCLRKNTSDVMPSTNVAGSTTSVAQSTAAAGDIAPLNN